MAAVRQPFGFKPSRGFSASFNPSTSRYKVEGVGYSNSIYPGDPVVQASGMNVRPLVTPVTAGNVDRYVGIVSQCLDANQKPLVFNQPNRGPFLRPTDAGFVDVYTDKANVYWVATDGTAGTPLIISQYVRVTAAQSGHANVAIGRSPLCVSVADTTVTSVATHPFFVVGVSQEQRDYLANPDWTEGLEVRIATGNLVQD